MLNRAKSTNRDRCWLTHRRREPWTMCPQCGAPIQWRKTDADGWIPVDEYPVLLVTGGKERALTRREILEGMRLYVPVRDRGNRPIYAYRPHYYSCPVLREERRAWAAKNKKEDD